MSERLTWQDVPGWFDFHGIYLDAIAAAAWQGAHFVEVGTLFGRSTIFMAQAIEESGKQITFDTIDLFGHSKQAMAAEIRILSERYGAWREHWAAVDRCQNMLEAFHYFAERAGVARLVNAHQQPAQERAQSYQDESLDFVFVDAQHTYADTVEILNAYLPKLKRGGILGGHDYSRSFPDVVRAVWRVFGNRHRAVGSSFVYRKDEPSPG